MKVHLTAALLPLPNPGHEGNYAFRQGQAELANATGGAPARLDAFQVSRETLGSTTTLFTLYKTKEGNWYEYDEPTDSIEATLRRAVKLAIDRLFIPHP